MGSTGALRRGGWALGLAVLLLGGSARAQGLIYPKDRAAPKTGTGEANRSDGAAGAAPAPAATGGNATTWPMRPWEAEPLDVEVVGEPLLDEERLIGDYRQPRWTARRRWPTTRVYVIPAGMIELEWWFRYAAPFDDPYEGRKLRSMWEWSMGLGHRLQLDLYLQGEQEGPEGDFGIDTEKVEMRYAFADWGEIWGNPTLYLEWIHRNAKPDKLEGKVLLGGALARGWHGAANLVYERELGGEGEGEYVISAAVSRTIVDSTVSMGLETKVAVVDLTGDRFHFVEQEYLLGPSLGWNPVPPANVLFVPLFGLGRDAPADENKAVLEAWLVVGWAF